VATVATAFACLAAAAPGCGPPAQEAPPSPTAFAISYERSGGLNPTPCKLTIRPGRYAAASTRVAGGRYTSTARFRVPDHRIRSLQGSLARANFAAIESVPPLGCADCYLYSIRYRGHEVTLQETDISTHLRRVIDQLEAVITTHTRQQPR
jgi:hypothetical protein